ncbi:hypothetical protein EIO_1210 [Ketogulonicigenium vulgare Y25]|uniref:hypothetical protein n=1 Tax=Ketogulonicigenium vulgare TaxID=92945 RepID=UPI0001E66997|nr:hypothetical protein [Ketogulonicigenium vulgare]ADO42353.1 hypothetical protein EIO_1210 [Ketogulonicigenium vulgare Y25]
MRPKRQTLTTSHPNACAAKRWLPRPNSRSRPAAEPNQPVAAREVSTDRADVLQVAGELIGQRRDNRVEAMHHAGLTIRAMQKRIDELTKPHINHCTECDGHGQVIGWLCDEDCAACDGTGKIPITQVPAAADTKMVPTRDQMKAEIDRLKAQLKPALEACQVIDAIVIAGYDNFRDMVMHMLEAVEPSRAALEGSQE